MDDNIDDLVEEILANWIRVSEGNVILKELEEKQNIICGQMISTLQEKAPELIPVFEDYQSALMGKEVEEDKAIYLQGAKDLVYLFKKIGVL